MPIYIAVPLIPDGSKLDNSVLETIPPADSFKLQADRAWLIKYNGTTSELSNHLRVTGHPKGEKSRVGSTLISPVPSYYGLGPSDMWEWLKNRIEHE
jgi:hypothetical protein